MLVVLTAVRTLCTCMNLLKVRRGEWQHQSAVFKLWDLGDSLNPIGCMHAEVSAYKHLVALQVRVVLQAFACVLLPDVDVFFWCLAEHVDTLTRSPVVTQNAAPVLRHAMHCMLSPSRTHLTCICYVCNCRACLRRASVLCSLIKHGNFACCAIRPNFVCQSWALLLNLNHCAISAEHSCNLAHGDLVAQQCKCSRA